MQRIRRADTSGGVKVSASIDVSPVGTYYGQLAAVLRKSLPETIRNEAAATVRRAMQMHKFGSVAKLRRKGARISMALVPSVGQTGGSINIGAKKSAKWGAGQVWARLTDKKISVPIGQWNKRAGFIPPNKSGIGWRLPDDRWREVRAAFQAHRPRALKAVEHMIGARGISAKSWYELLLKINAGHTEGVQDFIRRARPVRGISRTVAFAGMSGEGSSAPTLTIANTSGITIGAQGARKLQSAIAIRRKFFKRSFDQGFLTDAKFVARNYKWAAVSE